MHEQQPKAALSGVIVPQRLPDQRSIGPIADPIAQNLRRVMWRGGDTSAEMKVYITTTVNFGDKPAGCIAIAAARETAAMDEG